VVLLKYVRDEPGDSSIVGGPEIHRVHGAPDGVKFREGAALVLGRTSRSRNVLLGKITTADILVRPSPPRTARVGSVAKDGALFEVAVAERRVGGFGEISTRHVMVIDHIAETYVR